MTPLGTSFEKALKAAYLGGPWRIQSGAGQGGTGDVYTGWPAHRVAGHENAYALCLAGDCASMSGEYDSLWLQQGDAGAAHIFVRKGKQLEIFEALDASRLTKCLSCIRASVNGRWRNCKPT
jgi:hypothetical protein